MIDKYCNCSSLDTPALRATAMKCNYCTLVDDIKQNGLAPDSPLLWALLPDDAQYLCVDSTGQWLASNVCPSEPLQAFWCWDGIGMKFYSINNIKINYTSDWKDSLTKRSEVVIDE